MHVKFIQWFHLALDSIGPKMYKQKPPRIKRKPKNICHVAFSNKTIEGNSVIRIFTYDLTTPICSKIFNFINFVSGLDVDQFFGDPTILPCNYNKSPFVAKDHDHILTRNLRIIKK